MSARITPVPRRSTPGRISHKTLLAAVLITGLTSAALAITLPYLGNFEADSPGTVPTDAALVSGFVGVVDTSVTGTSNALRLRSGTPPGMIGYDITGAASGAYWLDFKVKPTALSEYLEFVDFDGACVALKTDAEGFAKFGVFNAETGVWTPCGSALAVGANGAPVDFVRLTIRVDYPTGRFHVLINGQLVAQNFLLADVPVIAPHALDFFSNETAANTTPVDVLIDDISLATSVPVGLLVDSDGDGLSDADELNLGTSPFGSDSDGDGIADGWEVSHGFNPLSASDAALDSDGDGLTNLREYQAGTDPSRSSLPGYGETVSGALIRDIWRNVTTTNLPTVSSSTFYFTSPPTARTLLAGTAIPTFSGALGERLQGFIVPTQTGDYRIAVASDDSSEVYLSTDATQSHAVKIAGVEGYTAAKNYGQRPSQVSAPVHLVAGNRYYMDVRHVNSGGSGHLSLAWRIADTSPWQELPSSVLLAGVPSDDFEHATPTEWERRYGAPGHVTRRVWPGSTQTSLISGANPVEATLASSGLRGTLPALSLSPGAASPRNTGDGFVQEISGYILPDVTGDYVIGLSSDDRGALYLSSDDKPESLRRVATVANYTSFGNFTTEAGQRSALIRLEAGKRYLFRAFGVEVAGGDHVQLGWATPGTTDVLGIPAANVAPAAPLPLYTPDASRLAFADDDGDGLNNLRESELGTNPAMADSDGDGIRDSWELEHGLNPLSASDGGADPDGDGLTTAQEYALGTNPFASDMGSSVQGAWFRERWDRISGVRLADFEASTSGYTQTPDFRGLFAGNEAASNRGDNYGERLRSWIVVPTEGDYVFFISGDDDVRFLLSSDEHVGGVRSVASVSGYTGLRQWLKYPSQRSVAIHLVPGVRYYAEIVHKEGGGSDHFSLGYKLASEADTAIRSLPGAWVSSFTSDPDDADGDGIPDAWEIAHGLSATSAAGDDGAFGDKDGDGLTNLEEFRLGLDPLASSLPVPGGIPVAGALIQDVWKNIDTRNLSAVATATSGYTTTPTTRRLLTVVETGLSGIAYGERIYGYLVPPVTGDYRFAIASDDMSELRLSTDVLPAHAVKIAGLDSWTGARNFSANTSQVSAPIHLEAGKACFLDVRHVNVGAGPGHLSLAWRTADNQAWQFIPASAFIAAAPGDDVNGNGLPDDWEISQGWPVIPGVIRPGHGANDDPDGDGLTNAREAALGAHPDNADTDGDGVPDGVEATAGHNPAVADFAPNDLNGNDLPDDWEIAQGWMVTPGVIDPGHGADDDPDGDALTNVQEYLADTHPDIADSDGDAQDDSYGAAGIAVVERWIGFTALPPLADFRISSGVSFPAGSGLTRTRTALTALAMPGTSGNPVGIIERVRGWITAPVTGDYTFTLLQEAGSATTNEARFLLSTDDTAANLTERAAVAPTSGVGAAPATVSLVAGQRYYYEIWTRKADASADTRLDWTRPVANP